MPARRALAALTATAFAMLLVPATAGATLVAAYETFDGGDFDLRLKNAATGSTLTLPAGVNTADDELHPALSADGRFLAWTRMKLQPQLDGDIVPPPERQLFWLDRTTGAITQLSNGAGGTGPTFTSKTTTSTNFTWGTRPATVGIDQQSPPEGRTTIARTADLSTVPPTTSREIRGDMNDSNLDIPHAAAIRSLYSEETFGGGCGPCQSPRDARYIQLAYHDPANGALSESSVRLWSFGYAGAQAPLSGSVLRFASFGSGNSPAGHPMPRSGDGYTALHLASGGNFDIQTLLYPTELTLTPAPAAINTANAERMPAWSPDGIRLGFIRTASGTRRIGIFNATPGVQNLQNTPIDIGPEAPTPQTRQFQDVFGGLSLAETTIGTSSTTTITCGSSCLSSISGATLGSPVALKPGSTLTTTIGIFVVRVTGTTKLLGRTVPRIRPVGRVPLGTARKGRNTFRWNGKVNGKRLSAGTYLLTFRALRGSVVTELSDSIRFKVSRSGKITGVRRER